MTSFLALRASVCAYLWCLIPLVKCYSYGPSICERLLWHFGRTGGVDCELTTELKSEEAVTDERAGVFTPDKKRGTADGAGRAAFD